MNNIMLIGRATKDPELKYLPNGGTAVSTFSIAVDKQLSKEKKQEAETNGQPTADFINIVVWGKQAESVANYLGKGKLVAIRGRIQTRNWDAQDGTKRYATEVVAEQVQFLEWKDKDNSQPTKSYDTSGFQPTNNEDVPF